ncbi:MAG: hypothetical protein ACQESR_24545 [Planctomycetota bacterium]
MESCPTQAVLPLVGLAADKIIRDRDKTAGTRRVPLARGAAHARTRRAPPNDPPVMGSFETAAQSTSAQPPPPPPNGKTPPRTGYSHNQGIERAITKPATTNPSIATIVTNFKRPL